MDLELFNKGEVLSKVTQYHLEREGGNRVFIDVHEIVAHVLDGEPKFKFYACPHLLLGGTKSKYITTADTAEEALSRCLATLKNADFLDVPEKGVLPPV